MKISLDWLNQYLDRPTGADEAQRVLTSLGFPVEGREAVSLGGGGEDTMLDVEVTSNRGDCLSHVGMARELAAGAGRTLQPPDVAPPKEGDAAADQRVRVTNDQPALCPLYTARVITGVKVAPSPRWLADRLATIGLRPVNNVVDVTNFVLHELGQPLHAFDLGKLAGQAVGVRLADKGQRFKAIDGSDHTLDDGMLVIADAEKPVAVAGVMGGADSEVGQDTTDLLLESAIFEPLSVRSTSRTLKLASDSSYRFERGIDPGGVEAASARAAKLIVDLAGGTLAQGVIRVGDVDTDSTQVTLDPSRCNALLGLELSTHQQAAYLDKLGLAPTLDDDAITCRVPSFRLDLRREVDLIEEVARVHGLDNIPLTQKIQLVARPRQAVVQARQELARVLTAHGYHETVTFSFVSESHGNPFTPGGEEPVVLGDQRRKAEPMLRPSLVPSLLICRKANQDAGNDDVRLYELGTAWSRRDGATREANRLTLLRDARDPAAAVRELRGTMSELVETLGGSAAAGTLAVDPIDRAGYDVAAGVRVGTAELGTLGVLDAPTCDRFGLQLQVAAAELDLGQLLAMYPPPRQARPLPRFPAIERDLSIVVDEALAWRDVAAAVRAVEPALLEDVAFLGAYRGKPIAKGAKSLSFRMLFRDPDRTLRHEQVDPQVQAVVDHLKADLGAQLRA